jgi:hypothetical protein
VPNASAAGEPWRDNPDLGRSPQPAISNDARSDFPKGVLICGGMALDYFTAEGAYGRFRRSRTQNRTPK